MRIGDQALAAICVGIVVVKMCVPAAAWASDQDGGAAYAFLFGAMGQFLEVGEDARVANLWLLPRVQSVAPLVPPYVSSAFDGSGDGMWLVQGFVYDEQKNRLFVLVPADTDSADGDAQRYRILILSPPFLELTGKIELTAATVPIPVLLLGNDGGRLLISRRAPVAQGATPSLVVVDEYDAASGSKIRSLQALGASPESPEFFAGAGFLPDGKTIYDGNGGRLRLDATRATRERIDVSKLLTEAQRQTLSTRGVVPKPWAIVDRWNNRVLLRDSTSPLSAGSTWQQEANLVFTFDLETREMSPPVETAKGAFVSLVAQGQKLLVESVETQRETDPERIKERGQEWQRRTGRLEFFDVATGNQIRALTFSEIAGDVETHPALCTAPDASWMVFSTPEGLLVLNLETGTSSRVLADVNPYYIRQCAFAH